MLKNYKKIITLILVFITSFLVSKCVYAASATINASKTQANVGDEITITTTIKGAAWQISLSGAVSEKYADNTDDAEDTTITKQTTFKPTKADTYTVNLSGNVTGENDSSSTPVSGSVKIIVKDKQEEAPSSLTPAVENTNTDNNKGDNQNVVINNNDNNADNSATEEVVNSVEKKKSDNANLSDLGIKPNDFKGFKPGNTSYDVTVPNDVEKVEIYAKTQDVNARATGGGNKRLNVGDNSFDVTVTAEDGKTKKIYTINIKREEDDSNKNETTVNETSENITNEATNQTVNEISQGTVVKEQDGDLKKLEVPGYILTPLFKSNVYEYKLSVSEDIMNLDVNAEPISSDVQVEIAGNKDLKEGENIVTIMCYNNETKKNTTYQIIVEKKAKENVHAEAINEANKKRSLIIKVGIGLIIVLIIACIIVFKKGRGEQQEEYEEIKEMPKNPKVFKQETENIKEFEKTKIDERKSIEVNEAKEKEAQKEMVKKEKTQKQREEEFDEKLQKIKSEKIRQQKGGKHF